MTPQEQQLLDDFLGRLAGVDSVAKDAQADALIRQRLAGRPDAPYLLVQRALLLERALEVARQQIAQLQQQAAARDGAAAGGGSFLGGAQPPDIAFGRGGASPGYGPAAPVAAAPTPAPSWRDRLFGGAAAPAAPAAAAAAGPSFLGQAARTAAGVAGGMFLFNGLENLMGQHGGGGFLGGGGNGLLGGMPPQETVVQNITNENFFPDAPAGGSDEAFRSVSDPGVDNGFPAADDGGSGDFQDDGGSFI